MNLLLTDHLTCPRCQAGAGLILLADRVQNRQVRDGQLGCPHCRERYPVVDGMADFAATPPGPDAPGEAAEAATLGALLGVTEGPAMLLMLGNFDDVAGVLATLIPDTEVVVARAQLPAPRDVPGVSNLRIAEKIPLYDRSMQGVVVARSELHLLDEAARVCALAARVVLLGAGAEVRGALPSLGLQVLGERADMLVAVRHT